MYCKICGTTLAPGEVFCRNCGASNTNMTAEPAAPSVEPTSPNQTVPNQPLPPNQVNQGAVPPNPFPEPINAEPIKPMEEAPMMDVNNETEKEQSPKKDNGKFLVVIGVIVGLLATAVIGYLIYSSLKSKNNNGGNGADITVVTQTNYDVVFANHTFTLRTDINSLISDKLEIKKDNWNAKIWSSGNPEFSKITKDNLKKSFEAVTDYKIGEISSKTYSNLSCFETRIDYSDGAKTLLVLCNRTAGGYWATEIGTSSYTAYPTSDIVEEVVTFIANAKKFENGMNNKLKVNDINIIVDGVSTTTASE